MNDAPEPAFPSTPQRHFIVILNEESGTIVRLGREHVIETLSRAFEQSGVFFEIHAVKADDLPGKLERAAASNADAVIIGGGDGTVATAATLLAAKGKTMGVLPLGTFNLAARDVGMPLDLEAAALALIDAEPTPIDAMEIDGRLWLCLVVMGFYPAFKMASPEHHGWWIVRAIRTLGDALRRAATFPALDLTLVREGHTTRARTRMVLITNNDYADVFGVLPQRTSLDGGFFTIYVSRHKTRAGMLRSVLAWVMGRWKQDRELIRTTATEIEIHAKKKRTLPIMRDGEVQRLALPLRITMRPKALNMLIPQAKQE